MKKQILLPVLGTVLLNINITKSQESENVEWSSARPDGHAPIGIMGDHYHKKGEFMFSYRYMPMVMEGVLHEDHEADADHIFSDGYMMAPQKMQMDMHMIGFMYAPSDRVTLMLMGNYLSNKMTMIQMMGDKHTMSSSGIGDVSLSGLIKILNKNRNSLHANVGISIPTGNINVKEKMHMHTQDSSGMIMHHHMEMKMAYPMQLGSGTWDPIIGVTYLGQTERISWGAQPMYRFRIGENSNKYTFGNRFDFSAWGSIIINDYLSFALTARYFNIDKIKGKDKDIDPMMSPLGDPMNTGRQQLETGAGINFYVPSGSLKNLRIAAEYRLPVMQKVNGMQMLNKYMMVIGLQYSFGNHDHH